MKQSQQKTVVLYFISLMFVASICQAGTLTVNNGATFKGTGHVVGDLVVNSGGTVEPWVTCLSVNNANFSVGSELKASIEGNVACSNYSQLVVNGEVDLADANLNASTNGYTMQVLDEYIFINNDDVDSILSPFNAINQNSSYTIDGELLYANYLAGDGNDFSLLFKFIYPIGGNVSGLAPGNEVFLQNGTAEIVSINSNGVYQFPTALDDNSAYDVAIISQPTTPNQTCTLSNASGTVNGGAVTDIDVSCVTNTYAVGGTVVGLAAGNQLVVQNNTADDLVINANGSFVFLNEVIDGTIYNVEVLANPDTPNQSCEVLNNSGTVSGNNITDVVVNCVTIAYSIGGNVSGLAAGNSVVLQNNLTDDLLLASNGVFSFNTAIIDETSYAVTVLSQPSTPNQTCTVDNGSGQVAGTNVTTVDISCVTNDYFIGGGLTGLASGNFLALQNNLGDDLSLGSNGPFAFFTPLADKSLYDVTVLADPTSPNQTCVVTDGAGMVAGDDVVDVVVTCDINTYGVGGTVSGLLDGETLLLQNNAGDNLTVFDNGLFVFDTSIEDLSDYDVTVLTAPVSPIQNCVVSSGQGTVNGQDVSDVMVECDNLDLIFKNGFEAIPIPDDE